MGEAAAPAPVTPTRRASSSVTFSDVVDTAMIPARQEDSRDSLVMKDCTFAIPTDGSPVMMPPKKLSRSRSSSLGSENENESIDFSIPSASQPKEQPQDQPKEEPKAPHPVYDSFLKQKPSAQEIAEANAHNEKVIAEEQQQQKQPDVSTPDNLLTSRQVGEGVLKLLSGERDEEKFFGCVLLMQNTAVFRESTKDEENDQPLFAQLLQALPVPFLSKALLSAKDTRTLAISVISFVVQTVKEAGKKQAAPAFLSDLTPVVLLALKSELKDYVNAASDADRLPSHLRLLAELNAMCGNGKTNPHEMEAVLGQVVRLVEGASFEDEDCLDISPPRELLQAVTLLFFQWRDGWTGDLTQRLAAVLLHAFVVDEEDGDETETDSTEKAGPHVQLLPYLVQLLDHLALHENAAVRDKILPPAARDLFADRAIPRLASILRTKILGADGREPVIRLAIFVEAFCDKNAFWRECYKNFGHKFWRLEINIGNQKWLEMLLQISAVEIHVNLWLILREDKEEEGDRAVNDAALSAALDFTEQVMINLSRFDEESDELSGEFVLKVFSALHKSVTAAFEYLAVRPSDNRARVTPAIGRLVCLWTSLEPRKFASEFLSVIGFLASELSRSGDLPMLLPALHAYEPAEWVPFCHDPLVSNLLKLCLPDSPAATRHAASATISEAFVDYRLYMPTYLKNTPELDYTASSSSSVSVHVPSTITCNIQRPAIAEDCDSAVKQTCLWAAAIAPDCAGLRLAMLATVPHHFALQFLPEKLISEIIDNALEGYSTTLAAGEAMRGLWYVLARAIAYTLPLYPQLAVRFAKLPVADLTTWSRVDGDAANQFSQNEDEEALTFDDFDEQREAVCAFLQLHAAK